LKKLVACLVFTGGLYACGDGSEIHCSENIATGQYRIELQESLNIEIPVDYYPGDRAAYALSENEESLLVTTGSDWFYTIDLEKGEVNGKQQLGVSKFDRLGRALYHNDDSIFFMHDYPPTLMILNVKGEVFKTLTLDDAPVSDWYSNASETLYGFNTFYPQATPALRDNELMILLASEFYYFPDKSKLEFFGAYDLSSSNWKSVFARAPREYLEEKTETPDSHLFPYIADNGRNILVSFPLSHTLQVYHRANDAIVFDSVICRKSQFMDSFADPLPLGESGGQRGRDYYVEAPAYSALSFHEAAGVFSRVVRHGLEILDPSVLPSLCDRNYSIQIFDEDLNFVDELFLESPTHQWAYPIPTRSGFLLMQRCISDASDAILALDVVKLVSQTVNQ
jgi:hypothetical protein